MASPTTPTHGKYAALYRHRPNGFKGDGLNDLAFGLGYSGADAAFYEVEIDAEATPDTFKWRKDGGAFTETVAITGAAQALDEDQTITFGATTGHTLGDRWVIGNLKAEATTESGAEAQITEATRRILNPNATPVFTDAGGANVLVVDHVRGKALFDANVGAVTVAGNNGYIPELALEKIGYLLGWSLDVSMDMGDASRCGQEWKEGLPGQAGVSGSADAFFIGGDTALDALVDAAAGNQEFFFLELFNYDPDQDQSGDHFVLWATVTGIGTGATPGEVVKEKITFQGTGHIAFVANV